MKLSIIVPVYNVEKYLRDCLDSLLDQDISKEIYEIVCVDDGSPDNCGGICDQYAIKDNRIRVIHKKNEGVSVARNTALEVAVGDFIMFVDSDDEIEPNCIEKLLKKQNENDFDLIISANAKDLDSLI